MNMNADDSIKSSIKKSIIVLKQLMLDSFGIFKALVKYDFFNDDFRSMKKVRPEEFVVIGNGPSLRETLKESIGFFNGKKIACVNEFALSEYFDVVKPDYCIFLDPGLWVRNNSEKQRGLNEKNFKAFKEKVVWPITIIMPLAAKKWNWFMDLPMLNKNVKICCVNTTVVNNCSRRVRNFLYKRDLAMPRPQTVLVGALFLALNLGYRKIFIVGADSSWHENFFLGEDNIVYSKNEHFYHEKNLSYSPMLLSPEETENVKMHVFFNALSQAFEGYQHVEEYASSIGAKIYNASKKTYIDAFERYKI